MKLNHYLLALCTLCCSQIPTVGGQTEHIVLQPQPGAMQVTARVPILANQAFALGIPETIGCREAMLVTLSKSTNAYMAATAMDAAFLFDNLDRCCIHAAPGFGDIGPGEASTTVSRLYLARGTLDIFLKRQEADRPGLATRQKWARAAGSASDSQGSPRAPAGRRQAADETRPHGRMEEMSPDELEKVLEQAPIAFVPLGTFEHHGWHLPVCFDGIKAHALCERVAHRTGGTVLPTFFYGTGGGHVGYKWTLMFPNLRLRH